MIGYLRIGIFMAELLYSRLKAEFINETFVIIVTYNTTGKYQDCVIGFHKLWDDDKYEDQLYLESFPNEAYGVIGVYLIW